MPTAASRATELLLALVLVAAPATSGAAPGKVLSVSATRAYLDRGAADGLVAGQTVHLRRGGEEIATCQVEAVSGGNARCRGTGLRPGDLFEISGAPPAPAVRGQAAPPPPSQAELGRRHAALVSAPVARVAVATSSRAVPSSLNLRGEAAFTHTSWMSASTTGFHGERLDVAIRGLELGRGFRLWVDLTGVQWISRPEFAHYRPDTSTHLLVRELAVSWREVGMPFAFAAGRLRPWRVPGVTGFDGAQAAWRTSSGSAEVGAFGGELPNVQTLIPQKAWLAGVYWSVDHYGARDDALRVLRHEARLSVVDGTALDTGAFERRFEAEAVLQAALWRAVDAGVDVRVGYSDGAGANLDAARVDFGVRPVEALRVSGGYRFDGIRQPELAAVDPQYRGRGQHADLGVSWDVVPALALGVSGGFAQEFDTDRQRGYAGPEIGLPRLFGTKGGLYLGYAEELGWTAGRTGWVQAVVTPAQRFQILARVSYLEDAPRDGESEHDLGLVLNATAPLVSWLSVRLAFTGRLGLDTLASGDPAAGFMGSLGLKGEL